MQVVRVQAYRPTAQDSPATKREALQLYPEGLGFRSIGRFLNCEVGARDTDTGRKRWDSIKNDVITDVMTDYWKPYENFIPPALHTQSNTHGAQEPKLTRSRATTACSGISWPAASEVEVLQQKQGDA